MESEGAKPRRGMSGVLRLWDRQREVIGIYFLLLCLVAIGFIFVPEFRRLDNLFNVLRQSAALGIASAGQTVAILVGGVDLSVGALISLVDVYASGFMANYNTLGHVVLMVFALLALGLLVGVINANIVMRMRAAPFIVTLGTGAILQGLVLLYAKKPGGAIAAGWEFLAEGMIGVVPFPVVLLLAIVVASWVMLAKTTWGRHVKAIGGSQLISRLSGVKTGRVITQAYMFCSLMAAVTGLYLTSRMGAGDPKVGGLQYDRFDLDTIAAVLIGGTRLGGGKGGIIGTLAGVLIVSVLNNIFNLIGVSSYLQWIIKGLILLGAVATYSVRRKNES